jgi:circadian clock protein KaiB
MWTKPASPARTDAPQSGRSAHSMTEVVLRLYVTGRTQSAAQAIATVTALQQDLGRDRVTLDVIDVLDDPVAALNDDVYATPTLFRVKPGPTRRIFGNLSSKEMLLVGLQLTETVTR